MKKHSFLAIGTGLLLSSFGAFAATYTDTDTISETLSSLGADRNGKGYDNLTKYYEDTFDITSIPGPDFNPATEDVVSATIQFWITDDASSATDGSGGGRDGSETATITLDTVALYSGQEIGLNTVFGPANISASLIAQLQDGILTYRVTATTGDFKLQKAELVATTRPVTNTPDGGMSLGLLGLSMLGFFGVSRRLAVK